MNYTIAVYGTLKRGRSNNYLLNNAEFLGEGTAPGKMYSAGGFPIATKEEGTMVVELFSVPQDDMRQVDMLEGHPDWYMREVVETSLGPAWLYYQPAEVVASRGLEVLESGEW